MLFRSGETEVGMERQIGQERQGRDRDILKFEEQVLRNLIVGHRFLKLVYPSQAEFSDLRNGLQQ